PAVAAAAVTGKICAVGGSNANGAPLTTVEVYAPNSWSAAASMPTARYGFAAAAVNGKIYAIGGIDGDTGSVVSTVEVYDPATNTWCTSTGPSTVQCPTPPAPMPTPLSFLAAATVSGKLYAISGLDTHGDPVNAVEIYDPNSN